MSPEDQYAEIEPDYISAVLTKRGWHYAGDEDIYSVYRKDGLTILLVDGDQSDSLSAVFDYEGPQAVAEIWWLAHAASELAYTRLTSMLMCPGMFAGTPDALVAYVQGIFSMLPLSPTRVQEVWDKAQKEHFPRSLSEPAWDFHGGEKTLEFLRDVTKQLGLLEPT